jgi:hypothetical protein
MVILRKFSDGIIGEVPLLSASDGSVIGKAELEKIGSRIMVQFDASDIPEAITQGFTLGSFTMFLEEPTDES